MGDGLLAGGKIGPSLKQFVRQLTANEDRLKTKLWVSCFNCGWR